MKRWHMTSGLVVSALAAWWIAPRLHAAWVERVPMEAPPAAPPPPVDGFDGALAIDVQFDQAAVRRGSPSDRLITVEVTAPATRSERRRVDVVVALDTSGSMDNGKLDQAREATRQLARQLGPDDTLGIVAFAGRASTLRRAAPVTEVARVDEVLASLYHYGGTNLHQGIDAAADALPSREGAVQKVLVLTDGEATEGELRPEAFVALANDVAASGVSLSTVGLGADYNEALLAQLADLGGGRFEDVAVAGELAAAFQAELDNSAALVARDTWVTVDLPDGVEPIDVIGWSAQRTERGWRVYLGDIVGGAKRKIVLRVRADIELHAQVAARADYHDLSAARAAVERDTGVLTATDDLADVAASLGPSATAARRAYGHWHLDMATRAHAAGDRTATQQHLAAGRDQLVSANLAPADLASDLAAFDAIDQLDRAPSPTARRVLKEHAERFRTIAR